MEHLAILPATVLSADPKNDWLSLGLALVLEEDLSTSKHYTVAIARDESAARQSGATLALQILADVGQHGRHFQLVLRDLATQQNRDLVQTSDQISATGSYIEAMSVLAKRLDNSASPFSTKVDYALRTYTSAVLAADLDAKLAGFQAAVQQDSAFGLAYLARLQVLDQQRQPTTDVYAAAERIKSKFIALDRAQFDLAAKKAASASLSDQLSAAHALIALTPNGRQARQSLAELQFANHDASGAAKTLAEVAGETAQVVAERAICLLVSGDRSGADQLAGRYLGLLEDSHDSLVPLARAAWLSISQSPAKATAYLETVEASASGDLKAIELAQIAIFQASDRQFDRARVGSSEASKLAQSPGAKLLALNSVLISESDGDPDRWRHTVQGTPLSADAKQWILGYGLFLGGHRQESGGYWQKLVTANRRPDFRAQAMLAAAKQQSASALPWFFPNLTGGDQFAFLTFQQMLSTTSSAR